MDKINCYNNLVNIYNLPDRNTYNFLKGILLFLPNIELIYAFLHILENRYDDKVVIFPSFKFDEAKVTKESQMEQLLFKIEDENNSNICKELRADVPFIETGFEKASCNFNYNKKTDLIYLELLDLQETRKVKFRNENKHSK